MKLEEILEEYSIPLAPEGHEHCTIGWVNVDCPWCSKDSQHFRLGYNSNYGTMHCWACGTHSLLDYLLEVTGERFGKCKDIISELDHRVVKSKAIKGKLKLPSGIITLQKIHKKYLRRRGYDPKQISSLWNIKGFGPHPRFSWRLFIPIYYKGEVVSFTTRSLSNKGVRYLSAKKEEEAKPHRELLYGEDWVRHGIIICEGPMDVWKIGPGAVATFGMGFRRAQVEKMSKYSIRVICYDSLPDAQAKAEQLGELLEPFPGKTLIAKLKAKDPGEAQESELLELRSLVHY